MAMKIILFLKKVFPVSLRDLLKTALFIALASVLCAFLRFFNDGDVYISMIFMMTVFLTSRFTKGYLYGFLVSVLGVFGINYFFTFPYFAFNISLEGYPITTASILVVSITTSALTSRLINQEELRKTAEHEKMRSNLLRSISHDLRTPLTSIMGASNLLKENEQMIDPDARHELYCEINEDASWLYNMVENLLSVTKLSDGINNLHKTEEIAEEIMCSAVTRIKKYCGNANVQISLPDEMLFVPMDRTLIEQVLINLIENSIRHGKTVTEITVSAKRHDGMAEFNVTDNGCGIEKRILDAINNGNFVFPHRSDDKSKYMGIGFSVCDTIIRAHGGKIKAENTKAGASVSFCIPITESE